MFQSLCSKSTELELKKIKYPAKNCADYAQFDLKCSAQLQQISVGIFCLNTANPLCFQR